MRVTGGSLGGRPLQVPRGHQVRPTSDRVRQAVFNVLLHGLDGALGQSRLAGARVLDAFAGSGALGIEAISRGASHATFLEQDKRTLTTLRANLAALDLGAAVDVVAVDATRPPPAPAPCALAFLDAPYGRELSTPALRALHRQGWLDTRAVVVVETGASETIGNPGGFSMLDQRRYGAARVWFLLSEGGPG